ncbi:MAG: glycerophosphodiester phosphodiesterase [Dehalococcoidia bacterium]
MKAHGRWPIRIAHRGGNSGSLLREALAAGVDWIEADIRLHYGRLVARHDRSIWRLPITYSRRSVALHLAPAIVLDTLLDATQATPTRVLIDLKGGHARLPDALIRVLRSHDAFDHVALCGQEWALLDRAGALDPRVEVIYSLGTPAHLYRYLARRRDGAAPPTTSCFHGLLTPARVAALKDAGSTIIAWTVDAEERAHQLLEWGVDGITSNRLGLLGRLRPGSRESENERRLRAERQDAGCFTITRQGAS